MSDWKLKAGKTFTDDEFMQFFAVARRSEPRIHLMMLLTYHAALKVSELIHLKVSDVVSEERKLLVVPSKKSRIWRSKGADGKVVIEDVDLPPSVPASIPQIVIDVAIDYILATKLAKGFLFPGHTKTCPVIGRKCKGGHISKRDVQYLFNQICDKAGIQYHGRGIQSLRHVRLTKIARRTKDVHLVQEIGRHASVGMSRHYVNFAQNTK